MDRTRLAKIKFAALLLSVIVIYSLVRMTNVSDYLNPMMLREKILGYGMAAPIIFIITYTILTILYIPGTPLTIASGILFGTIYGTVYTVVGAISGASIAFLFSRFLGKDYIQDLIERKYSKIKGYNRKLEKNGFRIMLFLRFIPLFPFNGLNISLGLTRVSFKNFFLGTLVGIIPGSFALAYFGDSITLLSPLNILLSGTLLLILFLAFPIYRHIKKLSKI